MRAEVLPYLRCPVCADRLAAAGAGGEARPRTLRCPRGHSFDVARQGYVHLAGRTPHQGDTPAMVAARADFLAAGHYDFLSAALARAAADHLAGNHHAPSGHPTAGVQHPTTHAQHPTAGKQHPTTHAQDATAGKQRLTAPGHPTAGASQHPTAPGHPTAGAHPAATTDHGAGFRQGSGGADAEGPDRPLVVDAGAGTGRHLAAVLDALPGALGLALDASKPALRRAARAHPRVGAVLCDTWGRLPLADGSASVLLDVFAPRNGPEFRRVLRPDGLLLVVTPERDHLVELVTALGLLRVDPEKPARVAAGLGTGFEPDGHGTHRRTLRLSREHVHTLVGMGPSAWHTDPEALAAGIDALPPVVTVTASVRLARYRPLSRA